MGWPEIVGRILTELKAYGLIGLITGGFFALIYKHGWPDFGGSAPEPKPAPELSAIAGDIAEMKTSLAVIEALLGARRK